MHEKWKMDQRKEWVDVNLFMEMVPSWLLRFFLSPLVCYPLSQWNISPPFWWLHIELPLPHGTVSFLDRESNMASWKITILDGRYIFKWPSQNGGICHPAILSFTGRGVIFFPFPWDYGAHRIRTNRYMGLFWDPRDWQVGSKSLGDVSGFSYFLGVVSGDYGKPWITKKGAMKKNLVNWVV